LLLASVRDTRGARQLFEGGQTLALQNFAEFLSTGDCLGGQLLIPHSFVELGYPPLCESLQEHFILLGAMP
jgi:hypothetical protein